MLIRKLILGFFVVGLAVWARTVLAAPGVDCAWPNNTTGAWTDAETWSCGTVPGIEDAVTVGLGAVITLDTAEAVDSLTLSGGTISGSGSLSVSGAVYVVDNLVDVTISTAGSYFPSLLLSPLQGIVSITDPTLQSGSLADVTVSQPIGSNAAIVLDIGAHPIAALTMNSGNLGWIGEVTVTNSLLWSNGSLGGGAALTMTVGAGATFTISEGGHSVYAPLVNEGTATWSGGEGMTGSFPAQFVNNGTLDADVTGDPIVPVSGFAAFVNNGTFRRNGGSGTLYFDVPVINNGTFEIGAGTVRFFSEFTQKSGLFQLNGATIEGNSQFGFITFEGGQLQGNGTLSVHVRNPGGTFYPTGEMKIVGSYVQGPAATLRVDIAGFTPATDFGLLTVTPNQGIGGGVTLDGHLLVDKSGGFVPASGDRFVIATCASQCNGAFISVDGSMSPTFSSFAAGGEVVVAEPTNAAILRSKPDIRVGERNSSNGYTLHIYNPSAEILTVSNLAATLPISFTYQTGSTTGILIADPFDAPGTDSRMLIWSGSFSVAGGAEAILHFHIGIGADMTDGEKTIDWAATGSSGGQTNPLAVNSVAPIDIRTGASAEVTLGGNAIVTNDPLPKLIIRRINLATTSISINARITCPYPTPCGTLSNVYVGQMVDGKGVTIFHLAPAVQAAGEESVTNDYGFWGGTIPGEGVIPGVPMNIYPDWDAHRPCIAFDFSGTGIRPTDCVGGGDPIATPHVLYDPSGVIRDSATLDPIVNATVTLYRIWGDLPDTRSETRQCRTVDTRPGGVWSGVAPALGLMEDANLTPRQIDPQVNPQSTGIDGRYGWNVVTGCWYVTVSAAGYASKTSPLVGVPPEVTDLDMTLDALNQPYQISLPQVSR